MTWKPGDPLSVYVEVDDCGGGPVSAVESRYAAAVTAYGLRRSDSWATEPVLHTFITDGLPDDDPRAWDSIPCVRCAGTVHSIPNECMDLWADTEAGPMCRWCLSWELDVNEGAL